MPSPPRARATAARSSSTGPEEPTIYANVRDDLQSTLDQIRADGLYKEERRLDSPQASHVRTNGRQVLNFCANNYLGLADDPRLVDAAKSALDEWGFGMASVRFICGTQSQHVALEDKLSAFLGTEATILFPSCFDANGGVFEVLLGAEDAVISDVITHRFAAADWAQAFETARGGQCGKVVMDWTVV